jgi:hypothetical protein
MPFSFLPSLPPRRQYFRRDVRRGALRESNYYFTPNRRGPEPLLLTEYLSPKISGLRSVSGNRLQWRTSQESNLRASRRKKEKCPAKPRRKLMRGVICGRFPSDFRLKPGLLLAFAGRSVQRKNRFTFPRVWVRSISGCRKVVKKNSYPNHKIFGNSCRKRLSVVVHVRRATSCFFWRWSILLL